MDKRAFRPALLEASTGFEPVIRVLQTLIAKNDTRRRIGVTDLAAHIIKNGPCGPLEHQNGDDSNEEPYVSRRARSSRSSTASSLAQRRKYARSS